MPTPGNGRASNCSRLIFNRTVRSAADGYNHPSANSISNLNESADSRPTVAFYCATFLKPEMLHIYRQITGLHRIRPIVIAQKREDPEKFPFDQIDVIPKPATHF